MNNHRCFARRELSAEALEEIRAQHAPIICPLCKGSLKMDHCPSDTNLPEEWGSNPMKKWGSCHKCQIVWLLELLNWTDERGDGMVTDKGHNLTLHAYANCFCQSPLIENPPAVRGKDWGVRLENNNGGHSEFRTHCDKAPKQ